MPGITYIGKKKLCHDNVAGTGLVWAPEETHQVDDMAAAAELLKYSDTWVLADDEPDDVDDAIAREQAAVRKPMTNEPIASPVSRREDDDPDADPEPDFAEPFPNLTVMSKDQMLLLCQTRYGESMDGRWSEQRMREHLIGLERAGRA